MPTNEELQAQLAALEQALEDIPSGWKNQRERRIRNEQRRETERQIASIKSQLQDPSARRIAEGTPLADIWDMSVDELVDEASRLYGVSPETGVRTGVTGIASDRNLERAIAVGNLLAKKAQDEIDEIEARPKTGIRAISERDSARVEALKAILTGKRKEAFDYPWSDKGLQGTVAQSTSRVAEIGTEEVAAVGESTEARGFDAFIELVSASDPDIRKKLRLAQGLNEEGEPLPRIRGAVVPPAGRGEEYRSAQSDLKALTKVFDDAMAGRPLSTEGMPGWIPDFLATSGGKAALEQAGGADVGPPAPTVAGPATGAPPEMVWDEATDTYIPAGTPTAPADAGTEEAEPVSDQQVVEIPHPDAPIKTDTTPTTTVPSGQKPVPGPTTVAQYLGGREPQDPLAFRLAPYRFTVEDAWKQAAIEWHQKTYRDYGYIGSDPSDVTPEMIEAFKNVVLDAISLSDPRARPTSALMLHAFLEERFISASTEPLRSDEEEVPGLADARAMVSQDNLETGSLYNGLEDDILVGLGNVEIPGASKRNETAVKPTEETIGRMLRDKIKVEHADGGGARGQWLEQEAWRIWTDNMDAIEDAEDPEDAWELVNAVITEERAPGGRLSTDSYISFERNRAGAYSVAQVEQQIIDALGDKAAELPLGTDEGMLWLERVAQVIVTKVAKVAGGTGVRDESMNFGKGGFQIDWSQSDARLEELINAEVNKSVEDLAEDMAMTEQKLVNEWVEKSGRAPNDQSILRSPEALAALKKKWRSSDEATEKEWTFQEWLAQPDGSKAMDDVLEERKEIIMGFDQEGARRDWFFGKLADAGLYSYEATTPEEEARLDEHFLEFERQVGNAAMREGVSISEALDIVGKTYIPTIPTAVNYKAQEDEKKRLAEAPFKPRRSPDQALALATAGLEERVGPATLDQDVREYKSALSGKNTEIAGVEADTFQYYVGDRGITDEELARDYADAPPADDDVGRAQYFSSMGIESKDERLARLNDEATDLRDTVTTAETQQLERGRDRELATIMMQYPELSRVFAMGSPDALKGAMADIGISPEMMDHFTKAQERQGLVLTEEQKKFRKAWGLPIPGDAFQTQAEIQAERDRSEATAFRQRLRTTQYEATGEERAYTTPDWEELGYDPMTMTRTGPLVGLGPGVNIPGTDIRDTPENRSTLKEQMEQGYQYKTYAPMETDDGEEITPTSPHEVDLFEEEAKEQPQFTIRRRGGGTGF